ncbi:hypothetical protein BATDEDRAFT_10009, partial [Batrachochytrium dendrobatidis JAM81]
RFMRAVIQRVSSASVTVDGTVVSRINNGLCILVGDTDTEMDYMQVVLFITKKIMGLKVFQGTQSGKQWDANIKDINGDVLCVSQFTLYAKTSKGNKPDFHLGNSVKLVRDMYNRFLEKMRAAYDPEKIKDGVFGAMMKVDIVNEGPVTIILDTDNK